MTRYLTLAEVLELHRTVMERWGGAGGIRDINALESALAQPRQSFGGQDLYPDLATKAAALCFSLVLNHPFVAQLLRQLLERATVDEQEQLMLRLAAGQLKRDALAEWVKQHIAQVKP